MNQTLYDELVTSEGALDFLWFYYLRQLKKGVDRGLFSGSGLTGIHAVCLGMFSKMLEQNADSLMRIVSLLDYMKKKAEEDKEKDFLENELNELLGKVKTALTTIKDDCKTLINLLPSAIDITTGDKEQEMITDTYKSIAAIVSRYHVSLVDQVGEISESYVTQRKEVNSIKDLSSSLFGEYENSASSLEEKYPGKGYSFIVSQVNAELKRIAKFPRNIAVICIAILAPMAFQKKAK